MGRPGAKRGAAPRNGDKAAVAAAGEDEPFETKGELPDVPEDPRLTVAGAKLGADGKLDVTAYEDLQSYFAGEPTPSKHPQPDRPGVRIGEDAPKGLRTWDDLRAGAKGKDGAGWIAVRARKNEPKREKWFNIRTCGSWRLAFLLARLQLELFDRGIGVKPRAVAAAAAAVAASAEGEAGLEGKAVPQEKEGGSSSSTPQKKRQAPSSAGEKGSARKKAKAAPAPKAKVAAPAADEKPSADVFAGSVRWQQILAARKAMEEKQQQEAQKSA